VAKVTLYPDLVLSASHEIHDTWMSTGSKPADIFGGKLLKLVVPTN